MLRCPSVLKENNYQFGKDDIIRGSKYDEYDKPFEVENEKQSVAK